MRHSVFVETLWDQRRSLVAWAIGIAAVTAIYSSFWPSARQQGADSIRSLPPTFRQAFNLGQLSSPEGYLQATVFNFIIPLLVILFVTAAGARAIAGDEEAGTLDLLLAHPIGRVEVVLHRFAALAAATLVVGAVTLLALLAVAGPAELGIAASNLAAMTLHLVVLGVCLGALALAVGAGTGLRGAAFAVTAIVAVLGYFANTLAAQQDATAWLRRLSPFFYYAGGQPLLHGVQPGDVAVLLGIGIGLVAFGTLAFRRRDIGV